jgi:hypothetical protein
LLNHRNDLDNSRRRLMRRQLPAHQVNRVLRHNNHPRADQLNPAHQHRAFLANLRRVLLVNRLAFLVNHLVFLVNHLVSLVNRLVSQELRRPQPVQERW